MNFCLRCFYVVMFLQTYREGEDRASDQNQLEGNHDAERSGECHLQRGECLDCSHLCVKLSPSHKGSMFALVVNF